MIKKTSSLFIVEAPGKTKKIYDLLEQIGFSDSKVIATKGRLFDLPKSEIGIDLNTLSITKFEAIDKERVSYICSEIAKCDSIYIMTDNDIEGEVIAKEISLLINKNKNQYRISIDSLTTDSLKNALSNKRTVNESIVSCGLSRRIFDRFIGYQLSSQDWENKNSEHQGVIGRILTPIISVFSSEAQESAVIQKKIINPNDEEWNINISISHKTYDKGNELKELIGSLPPIEIKEKHNKIIYDNARPWSGDEALLELGYTLNKPVNEISQALQSLYENGEISYPRTDSFSISKETALKLSTLAAEFGITDFSDEYLLSKTNIAKTSNVQGAHEALVPLTNRVDIRLPLISLDIKDQILVVLTKNILRAGRTNLMISQSIGEISSLSPYKKDWDILFSQINPNQISISRNVLFKKRYMNNELINSQMKPNGFEFYNSCYNNSYYRQIPIDIAILRVMISNKIGRPSTMSYHATKIASKYINEQGRVNQYAVSSLNRALLKASGLLSPAIAANIEHHLHLPDNKSIKDKVIEALELSKVDISGISKKSIDIKKEIFKEITSEFNPM